MLDPLGHSDGSTGPGGSRGRGRSSVANCRLRDGDRGDLRAEGWQWRTVPGGPGAAPVPGPPAPRRRGAHHLASGQSHQPAPPGGDHPRPGTPEVAEILWRCADARRLSAGWFDPWAAPGGVDPSGMVRGWSLGGALDVLRRAGVRAARINAGIRGGGLRLLADGTTPGSRRLHRRDLRRPGAPPGDGKHHGGRHRTDRGPQRGATRGCRHGDRTRPGDGRGPGDGSAVRRPRRGARRRRQDPRLLRPGGR